LSLLSIFAGLMFFYRPTVYQDFRSVLLVALLMATTIAAAAVIAGSGAPFELVPMAFPALVIAMLWDGRMALNMSLVLALLLGAQTPFLSLSSHLMLAIGGAAAALSVRVVRRRAQGLILGAFVAFSYALLALALGLLRGEVGAGVFESAAWGTVNGIGSALLALGFMPLFEAFTRITTDQTLLELADLNRPLLKRLSLEASGTYAHSINVANLAEAAAHAIGANALLVRVGAYYHDVGKLAAPQYFIENQARGRNPHDQLDPGTSAALVRSHVLEGIRLAEQANLPEAVKQFIPEHHGTQKIAYFLEQARRRDESVDASEFTYQGPKPQSRETAILMLADSIESAMKVLQDPTAERIRELVDRIVAGKIAEGQLEEAPLTMRELSLIKQQFVSVLLGMYHHRIDYPTQQVPPPAPVAAAGRASP
ncbi:MAG: HDIG domain-containing protein, partial [Candidatus Cloacimonetes bacterium]|nr:HDIG domain-containing protein [Candidatus Cloacimonadota bacterium]